MTMYIGPARSPSEAESARHLAASIFGPLAGHDIHESEEFKSFIWNEPGYDVQEHIVVMAIGAGNVVGCVRLLPRHLHGHGDIFLCAGISSVCIAEEYRGSGKSHELMVIALEQARLLGYEVTILFARRALDYYYTRFNIWGLSSYNRVSIAVTSLKHISSAGMRLRIANNEDLLLIRQYHKSTYHDCFGYIERSDSFWLFLIHKLSQQKIELKTILYNEQIIGYIAMKENVVHEFALKLNFNPLPVIKAILPKEGELIMELPEHHNVVKNLALLDYSVSYRQCVYGGHMIGVLDKQRLISKLAERIKRDAKSAGIGPYHERVDGLDLDWDGQNASVRQIGNMDKFGFATTARLLGAQCITGVDSTRLAPGKPLNFSTLDHF